MPATKRPKRDTTRALDLVREALSNVVALQLGADEGEINPDLCAETAKTLREVVTILVASDARTGKRDPHLRRKPATKAKAKKAGARRR